ncbi:MAG: serine protease [Alphaproteobacteria bacterium]
MPLSRTCLRLLLATAVSAALAGAAAAQDRTFNCKLPDRTVVSRIVGGQGVKVEQFPWQVSIAEKGGGQYDGHFCGGVLIGAQWVLTAGHCMTERHGDRLVEIDPAALQVLHGTTNLRSGGERREVAKLIVHPEYTGGPNDIALLKLDRPYEGARRTYAMLPRSEIAGRFVFDEACAVVTGWGTTEPDKPLPPELRAVAMPIVDQETCKAAYAKHYGPNAIADNEVCAGFAEGGRDSCQGDSGGPLVVEGGPSGYVLAGITSWGGYDNKSNFYCALREGYGVYARISSFVPWILETIRSN